MLEDYRDKTAIAALLHFRPNILINLNEIAGESGRMGIGSEQKLSMLFASYFYYNDITYMVASIFRGIVCGHMFINGNKRTAVLWLLTFCQMQELPLAMNDDQLYDYVLELATDGNSREVEEIAYHLFPQEDA